MRRTNAIPARALLYAGLSLYALVSFYPLVWMAFNSLKNNEEILITNPFGFPSPLRFANYRTAVETFDILRFFMNSFIIAAFAVTIGISLILMFSYATTRMRWKLANLAWSYIAIGLFLPIQIILIPLVVLTHGLHLSNTYVSLIVPYIAIQFPFSAVILHGFFKTIPYEIEEAATIDGAGPYRSFFSIIVPLLKPAVATLVIFQFMGHWNEFTIALVMISKEAMKTLPLGLVRFQGQFSADWGGMAAALVLASLPTVLIYLVFSDQVEKALTVSGAVKG